jgi:UDPglucose--hexose-1-phosphate uridylyltransferase
MPELRRDPVTGRWVVIATERARRPESFSQAVREPITPAAACPFDEGNEHLTPPEVFAIRRPGSQPDAPGWSVRVVPNLYPAFTMAAAAVTAGSSELFQAQPALGAHEVIISSPDHTRSTAQLPLEQVERMVRAWIARMRTHAADPRIAYTQLIYNHGRSAGASLEHPHAQLFAMPFIPPVLLEEMAGAERFYRQQDECVFCAMLEAELAEDERLVFASDRFVTVVPFASRVPFETWILPRHHQSRFEDLSAEDVAGFAEMLQQVTAALQRRLNDPPYNFFIHTAPCRSPELPHYHWHLELLPRLTTWAGLEYGTGVIVNIMTPEAAAVFLRG